MSPLTGTGELLRLALRRDRIRLLVWTLAVGLGVYASVSSLVGAFPTPETIRARGALLTNPATLMMTGPAFAVDDYIFGAMVANELSLYVFLTAGIMAVLTTVRHTRAEEESGRLEMVRARPVGRFAPSAAAGITVTLACVLLGAATAVGLLAVGHEGLDTAGCLAFGAATTLTGLVFAGLAAVAAQLTEHARTATGLAMGAVAVSYLVRGIGDVIEPTGSWLSWFSPFAWAQQTRLFVDLRWWPLAASLALTLVAFAVAAALAHRRDLGAGLRPARRGPDAAAPPLGSPTGLAARMLRVSTLVWAVGSLFFAVAMGALADSLDGMLEENPTLAQWMTLSGTDPTTGFAGVILSFVMTAPLVCGVSGILTLTSEETSGRSELYLVSGRSRAGQLTGWALTVLAMVVLLTLVGGAGVGLGVWTATGDTQWIGDMTVAAAAYLPALVAVVGLAMALYGLLPRAAALAWAAVVWIAVVLFLGDLLALPDWATDLSTFTHVPALPAADIGAPEVTSLLVLTAVAAVLAVAGIFGYRRRDLRTG